MTVLVVTTELVTPSWKGSHPESGRRRADAAIEAVERQPDERKHRQPFGHHDQAGDDAEHHERAVGEIINCYPREDRDSDAETDDDRAGNEHEHLPAQELNIP